MYVWGRVLDHTGGLHAQVNSNSTWILVTSLSHPHGLTAFWQNCRRRQGQGQHQPTLSALWQLAQWVFTQLVPAVSLPGTQLLCGGDYKPSREKLVTATIGLQKVIWSGPQLQDQSPHTSHKSLEKEMLPAVQTVHIYSQNLSPPDPEGFRRLPRRQATPSFILCHLTEDLIQGALQVCWVPLTW